MIYYYNIYHFVIYQKYTEILLFALLDKNTGIKVKPVYGINLVKVRIILFNLRGYQELISKANKTFIVLFLSFLHKSICDMNKAITHDLLKIWPITFLHKVQKVCWVPSVDQPSSSDLHLLIINT